MSAVLKESPLTLEMIEPVEHPTPAVQRTSGNVATIQPGPMGSALAFLQAGGTTDQMREILALQREWEENEARKAYFDAVASFKLDAPTVYKDKDNNQYKSRYTSIGNLVNTVNVALSRHGLTAKWSVDQSAGIKVTCTLAHRMGFSESASLSGPPDTSGAKNPLQQIKSTVTYLKLATYEAITGIATAEGNEDDDGNGSGTPKPPAPPAPPPASYPQAGFDKNLVAWRQLIETGKKTADQILATLATKGQPTEEQARILRSFKKAD